MLTREEIQIAIQCNNWQRDRLALKGTSTEHKISWLKSYLASNDTRCCSMKHRRVQVYNYLNALSRGGLIHPVVFGDLEEGRVRIKR